jgi:hypothetical protein
MDQQQPGVAQGMGIDPALCEQLIAEASQLQADGQRKMSISEELFAQIQGAMQNFYAQKQQVQQEDIATAMNAQQLGAIAGRTLFELEFTPDQKAYRAKRAAKLSKQTSERQKKVDRLVRKGLTKSEATREVSQKKERRAAYWGGSYGAIKSRQRSNAINANLEALAGRTLFELNAGLGRSLYKKYGGITRTATKVAAVGAVGGAGYLAGKRRQKKLQQQQQQQPQQPQQPQSLGALAGRTLFELGLKPPSWKKLQAIRASKKGVRTYGRKLKKKPQRPFIDPNSAAGGIIN